MEIWAILLRTFLIYFVVFFTLRLMGKREIGKLSVFDLVISVMIAEIAVIVIEDTKRPLLEGIVPMAALVLVQIGTAFFALKNRRLRLWFDGKPTVIVERGKINREAMRKMRYNLDDLMLQLRENKIATVDDVEFAILETTGKLSVIEKPSSKFGSGDKAAESENANRLAKPFPEGFRFEALPVPLIMDGRLQSDNLDQIGKDRFWLNNRLREKGVSDMKQVMLCTIDHKGKLYIDARRKTDR